MSIERNVWHDVVENKRTYFYPGGDKFAVLNVERFKVSENGRHYLQKANGQYVIARKGWLGIKVDGDLVAE